ncbi:predicted protein [Naegleria gruberi]|uniref:Palmitoyltransferase n=1 Tax=Naegleria gruberi TaxID=5762 RepID=D2VGJ2_NAEGR|nr:uncharacterized protein NAEGRDRAFT_49357 [Naegleria gruberi]EFC44075.1 predicted protein [Naegleria gruberi]|eukprot:XP_002676819.1 predicted protein [Naegleria gruberi strain NEG-M]
MCSEDLCLLVWDKSCDVACSLGCNLCLCRYRWCPCYECCNEDEEEEENTKSSASSSSSEGTSSGGKLHDHHHQHDDKCNCNNTKKTIVATSPPTLSEEELALKKLKRKEKNMHYNRKLEAGVYYLILFGFLYMGVIPFIVSYYWIDIFGLFVDSEKAPNMKYPLLELQTTYSTQDWDKLNLLGAHWSFYLYYIGWILSYITYEMSKRSNPGRIFVEGDEKHLGYISHKDSITFERKEEQKAINSEKVQEQQTSTTTLRNRKSGEKNLENEKQENESSDSATAITANATKKEETKVVEFPTRSKFCTRCGHRAAKYDHHCLWISNCVGEKNQLTFLAFLLSMVVQMSLCFIMVICLFYLTYCEVNQLFDYAFQYESMKRISSLHGKRIEELYTDGKTQQMLQFVHSNNPIMQFHTFLFIVLNVINLGIAGLVLAFVGFMSGVQLYMITFNMASVEHFNPEKYTYQPKIQRNWRKNWMLFYQQIMLPFNKFTDYDQQ